MENGLGFYIGRFFIAYYGLMIVLGLAASAAAGWYQVKKFHKSYDEFILLFAFTGLCGIAGAKILYLLVSLNKIDIARLPEASYLSDVMSGGFVFYGGLIGGGLGLLMCGKLFKIDVRSLISVTIPCLPIAHGFGRIGCSLVGCCYGRPYQGWGAVTYKASLFAPNNTPLFPVQIAEAAGDLMIAAVLLVCINRCSYNGGLKVYLIMYSVMRIILEFFRYDYQERGVYLGVSTSQLISLALILGVMAHQCLRRRSRRLPM